MWPRNSKIDRLKQIERGEIDSATEEWARRQLRPPDVRFMERAKRVTKVLTVVSALAGAAGTAWGWIAKGAALWRARGAAPEQLPRATGAATTAPDFVDDPSARPPSRGP